MEYAEKFCQLCGVSFNIHRIRSKDEPRSAAFGGMSGSWVPARTFLHDLDQTCDDESWCSEKTGCCMVYRKAEMAGIAWRYKWLMDEIFPDDDDPRADPDYVFESSDEEEPLEYDSDAASEEETSANDQWDETGNEKCLVDWEWIFEVNPPIPEFDAEFLPISTTLGAQLVTELGDGLSLRHQDAELKANHLEHIAGSGCRKTGAFLPWMISPHEMRNCHTVQCLFLKPSAYESATDDLDFERNSHYFLSGVAEKVPNSFWDLELVPVRNGADFRSQAYTDFSYLETPQDSLNEIGLPFHPTCFEIFLQASRKFFGHVDIDALVRIRDKAALDHMAFPMRHQQVVCAEREEVWKHTMGREYLVANPVFIPGFRSILEASVSNDDNFSVQHSAFDKRPQKTPFTAQRDPFQALPKELVYLIVRYLHSGDIASLRLASRAFTHLPISLWYHLILKEIPYLYEAWSRDPTPYYWATVIASDLITEGREYRKFHKDLEKRSTMIRQDMPEIADQWIQDNSRWEWPEHKDKKEMLQLSPIKLPYERTNWYQLYRELTVHSAQLKGLRNRARIWDCMLQIIDAIKALRSDEPIYRYQSIPWSLTSKSLVCSES